MTPIIGISTNLHTVDKGKFLGMERIYVNKDYIDAVVKEVVQLRQFLNNMERDSIKWISFSFVLLLFSS